MNKLLSLLMCLLFVGSSVAWAWTSDDDYVPLAREGNEWGYREFRYRNEPATFDFTPLKNYIYYIHGDTILNGISYKKLCYKLIYHNYFDEATGTYRDSIELDKCIVAIRDEGKQVYAVNLSENIYGLGSTIFIPYLHGPYWEINQEGILYDFENVYDFVFNQYLAMFGDNEWFRNDFQKYVQIEEVETGPCIKVEGRRAFSVYDGFERGTFVEGIGVCPPSRDVDLLRFVVRTIYGGHPGGDLIYMRNGDGVYEYLAEGLEVSEIEAARVNHEKPIVRLSERLLSIDLHSTAERIVTEVFSADGRSVARKVASGENVTLSLAHLPAGVYVVTVGNARFSHNTKIILK